MVTEKGTIVFAVYNEIFIAFFTDFFQTNEIRLVQFCLKDLDSFWKLHSIDFFEVIVPMANRRWHGDQSQNLTILTKNFIVCFVANDPMLDWKRVIASACFMEFQNIIHFTPFSYYVIKKFTSVSQVSFFGDFDSLVSRLLLHLNEKKYAAMFPSWSIGKWAEQL